MMQYSEVLASSNDLRLQNQTEASEQFERQCAPQKSHDINKRTGLQKENENSPESITVSITALTTAQTSS